MAHYETFTVEKYVITGGPCTGKSSTIDELKSLGQKTVEEAARSLIKEGYDPAKDPLTFQRMVIEKQLSLEARIPEWTPWSRGEDHFLDRGVFDNVVYCTIFEVKVPEILQELISQDKKKQRYTKVFVLDPLPLYKNDAERPESEAKAKEIHAAIVEAYKEIGYKPIHVPVLTPKERAQYIMRGGK